MKNECFNQRGQSIGRVGKASIQRHLMKPDSVTGGGPRDYAMVWCPDLDIYISRYGTGQRSCEFVVTFWKTDDLDEDATEVTYPFAERDKAIQHFMRLRNKSAKANKRQEPEREGEEAAEGA